MINNEGFIKKENGVVENSNIEEFERYRLNREKNLRNKELAERVNDLEKTVVALKKTLNNITSRMPD